MSQKLLPKFWISNARGTKTHCQVCNVKFQLIVKQQHQCKRCLRAVCENCGPERRLIYDGDGSSALRRTCIVCIKQIDTLEAYHNEFKLCFGTDSEFVDDWINKVNKQRRDYQSIITQYTDNLTGITNDNIIKFKHQADNMFADLLESFNYSFRHFVKIITGGVSQQLFQSKIRNVMIGVYARVKIMPFVPQLIYLAVFFLCFVNEAHAYFIISRMIQKIYPQYVRVKKVKKDNLLSSALKTIMEMYRICVDRVDRSELQAVAQYLEHRFTIYIISFSLNVCSVVNSFYIIDDILKSGNYLSLYKGIAALLCNCREQISSYKSFSQVEIPLLKNVSLQKLKSCFIKFEKSDAKFQINNELFDSAEHRKLHEKYKQIESLYSKSEKSLNEKQNQIKQMLAELAKRNKTIDEQSQKIIQFQKQLLKLSEHVPKIVNYSHMEQVHEQILKRNNSLQEECHRLQVKIQKMEKQNLNNDKYNQNWSRMEQNYIKQLVELRTKNQIMEIQLAAKQIDFNTSFIERKLQQKNIQIKILNQEVQHLKSELEFYKLKILEKSFSVKGKGQTKQNGFHLKRDTKDEMKQNFEKHIKSSQQLVKSLQKEVEQFRNQASQYQRLCKQQKKSIQDLQSKLTQVQQISQILKLIPNEYSYGDSIAQLNRVIEKQTNFMKKHTLQSVKSQFQKCYKELKFRVIDCRVKQARVRDSPLIKILNPQNYKNLQSFHRQDTSSLDSFVQIMRQQQNLQEQKNKQCIIM